MRRKWLAHILVDFKIIIACDMSKIAFLHFVIMLLLLLALWETKESGPSEWKRKITSWCFVFVIIGHRVEWNRIEYWDIWSYDTLRTNTQIGWIFGKFQNGASNSKGYSFNFVKIITVRNFSNYWGKKSKW